MNEAQQRIYLIRSLLRERGEDMELPADAGKQRELLRALMNVRPPAESTAEFLQVQDAYLQTRSAQRGVTELADLAPVEPGLYLWQGDITTLRCDAIVNAANSGLTGCYMPLHNCIDNCIHTYAGVQLRLKCAELIRAQGHEEPTGQAKITPAYNLPCRYVLHTVGPIVQGQPSPRQCEQLASCYRACLRLAQENGCESLALCCISTGVFGFPQQRAAEIAVQTVREHRGKVKVIFNVFKEDDLAIYRRLLG